MKALEAIGTTARDCAPAELVELYETMVEIFGTEEALWQMKGFWESLWRVSRLSGGLAQMLVMVRAMAGEARAKKDGVS